MVLQNKWNLRKATDLQCGHRRSRISQASSPLLWESPCFHACGSLAFWPWLRYRSYCEFLKFFRKEMLKGEGWIPFFPGHLLPSSGKRRNSTQSLAGHPWQRDSPRPGGIRSLAEPPGSPMFRAGSFGKEGMGCRTVIWIGKNPGESQTEITCCRRLSNHIKGWSRNNSLVQAHLPHILPSDAVSSNATDPSYSNPTLEGGRGNFRAPGPALQ